MPQIASVNDIGSKYERRASTAGPEYSEGVARSSDEEWAAATSDAEDTWSQGVQEAAQNGAFQRGVQNTNKSWQQRASDVGANRYQQGVQASVEEYEAGFAPYRDLISNTSLPPRGPRGDPGNYDRVRQMGQALHDRRQSR